MVCYKLYLFQYFNNEKHEANRYDEALQRFQAASLKTSTSLAVLNFGQNAIFQSALATMMLLSAKQISQGIYSYVFFCVMCSNYSTQRRYSPLLLLHHSSKLYREGVPLTFTCQMECHNNYIP